MMRARVQAWRIPVAALAAVISILPAESALAQKKSAIYEGTPVPIGHGWARTVVRTDAKGKPASVSVVFSTGALEGLPAAAGGDDHNFAYLLAMPTRGPKTLVDHVVVNWHSTGHPPPKVYDVPHFDFHFYLVSYAEQMKVTFANEAESGDPSQQPPAEMMPTGYLMPPGTAVPKMGAHAIDPSAPEFNGQPFAVTLIYGYYNKRHTFIEPMASLDFLRSKQPFLGPVPRPAGYSEGAAFPSMYSIKYDEKKMTHTVTLEGLK